MIRIGDELLEHVKRCVSSLQSNEGTTESKSIAKDDEWDFLAKCLERCSLTVPVAWFNYADELGVIETFAERCPNSQCRRLAHLLMSQLYFHLELYESALEHALLAQDAFRNLLSCFYQLDNTTTTPTGPNDAATSTSGGGGGGGSSFTTTVPRLDVDVRKSLKLFADRIVALALEEYVASQSSNFVASSQSILSFGSPRDSLMGGRGQRGDQAAHLHPQSNLVYDPLAPASPPTTRSLRRGLTEGKAIDHQSVSSLVSILLAIQKTSDSDRLPEETLRLILGIALEADDTKKVEEILTITQHTFSLLRYIISNQELLMASRIQRDHIFNLIANLYKRHFDPLLSLIEKMSSNSRTNNSRTNSHTNANTDTMIESTLTSASTSNSSTVPEELAEELPFFAQTLSYLNDVETMATLLRALVVASLEPNFKCAKHWLQALQISFDVLTFASQSFINRLKAHPLLRSCLLDNPHGLAEQNRKGNAPAAKANGEQTAETSLSTDPSANHSADPSASNAKPATEGAVSQAAHVQVAWDGEIEESEETQPLLPDSRKETDNEKSGSGGDGGAGGAVDIAKLSESLDPESEDFKLISLMRVLSSDFSTKALLRFSNRQNATDLGILDYTKSILEHRHAVLHTALIVCHGFMQRGTTNDLFLRKNLEWFGKATCWGKFMATASLGVVHQTHCEKSFRVLSTYLPGLATGSNSSSYSDGGSMYALGLIHANRADDAVMNYLLGQLTGGAAAAAAAENVRAAASGHPSSTAISASHPANNLSVPSGVTGGVSGGVTGGGDGAAGAMIGASGGTSQDLGRNINEVMQHGACLGLGLSALATCDARAIAALKTVLMLDVTVSGEAAGLALGVTCLGSGDQALVNELLVCAAETRHEKIIRACGLAVAMVSFRREEKASEWIAQMIRSNEALIRYGACYTMALAYCGTASDTCLRQLLHQAVSDPSEDVRRAAIISIAFVLCNAPQKLPRLFKLLADSFSIHARYATLLALGIGCAASKDPEALAIVCEGVKDPSDIVRQAAHIALGLILQQTSEKEKENEKEKETTNTDNSGGADGKDGKEADGKDGKEADGKDGKAVMSKGPKRLPANPSARDARDYLLHISCDLKTEQIARVGALLGLGLLDAGGRNTVCSFFSPNGQIRQDAVVGYLLFAQYWHWYPMMHMLSLTMTPNALIAVDSQLRIPQAFHVECLAPKNAFTYPPKFEPPKKNVAAKNVVNLLATEKKAAKKPGPSNANADDSADHSKTSMTAAAPDSATKADSSATAVAGGAGGQGEVRKEEEKHIVKNMSRLINAQLPILQASSSSRYTPIFRKRKIRPGMLVVFDNRAASQSADDDLYT